MSQYKKCCFHVHNAIRNVEKLTSSFTNMITTFKITKRTHQIYNSLYIVALRLSDILRRISYATETPSDVCPSAETM